MQHAFYSSMIVSKAPQNIKSVEDSSRKNGKDPRRISSIVLVLFRLYSFPLQRTSLHFSELSSAPASHLVLCDSQGMLLSSFSEVQRILKTGTMLAQFILNFSLRQNKSGGRFFALRLVDGFNLFGFGGNVGIEET